MKKVLYISNIQVPYRVRFFNELSKYCDLTVLYERSISNNRNNEWANSEELDYKQAFLDGIKIGNESSFSLGILRYILGKYDVIIIGCYSTPVQIFANIILRLKRKPFFVNFDGEVFADKFSVKTILKRTVLKGASYYLIAGEKAADNLKKIVGKKHITPYYFSSLSKSELKEHRMDVNDERKEYVLVVGQYFDYKGLDVAVKAAKKMPQLNFKFVGMGNRTDLFVKENDIEDVDNIEVVPFLQKKELEDEYVKCKCLLLPTRQECWGLVINEAASFGTPIVSTWGSGAGVEFLADDYPMLLAKPGDENSIVKALQCLDKDIDILEYSKYLIKKSEKYNIEKSVKMHLEAFEKEKHK